MTADSNSAGNSIGACADCGDLTWRARLLGQAQASGGDPLQLTRLFGISDPTAIRYCAEIGPGRYDEHQALEGAAGSAGRTESTSAST